MTPTATASNRWDQAGLVASTACAVHCVALPLVIGLLPIVGLQHLGDERFEWGMIAFTAAVGLIGHVRAYRRSHRHAAPALVFIAGFAMVVGARLLFKEQALQPWALGFGGLLAAASHYANLRLCRCCSHAGRVS